MSSVVQQPIRSTDFQVSIECNGIQVLKNPYEVQHILLPEIKTGEGGKKIITPLVIERILPNGNIIQYELKDKVFDVKVYWEKNMFSITYTGCTLDYGIITPLDRYGTAKNVIEKLVITA